MGSAFPLAAPRTGLGGAELMGCLFAPRSYSSNFILRSSNWTSEDKTRVIDRYR